MYESKFGWKNKKGTSERICNCGSWKQHWINFSDEDWPILCRVSGCTSEATLGAHVIHPGKSGEHIVPMCISCNNSTKVFTLKKNTSTVSADQSGTCG